MITLWNALLLAALGPFFVAPLLLRQRVRVKAQARKGART